MFSFSNSNKAKELAFYQHIRTDPALAVLASKFMEQDMNTVNLEEFEREICKIVSRKLHGMKKSESEQSKLEEKYRGILTLKMQEVFKSYDQKKEKVKKGPLLLFSPDELTVFLEGSGKAVWDQSFDYNLCLSKVIEPLKSSFIFGEREIPLEAERIIMEINQSSPETIDFPHYRSLLKTYGIPSGGRRDTYFRLLFSKLPELYAPKEFPVDTGKIVKLYSYFMKDSIEVNQYGKRLHKSLGISLLFPLCSL